MVVGGEKKADGDKLSDGEKKIDGDRKSDDNKKAENMMSVEDKLAQLEKRFADLDRHLGLTYREPEQRENTISVPTTPVNAGGMAGAEESSCAEGRVRVVNSKIDRDGQRRDHALNSNEASGANRTNEGCAVMLRRHLVVKSGEIEVFDSDLRALLKRVLAHYPGHYFVGETMEISSPYEPLVLNWDLLREEAEKQSVDEKDNQARTDLRELLDTIQSGSGDPKLDAFDGPKPIASLPFCPLSAIEPLKREEIKTDLLKRGKLFKKYCTDKDHRMYAYKGDALFDKRGFGATTSTQSDLSDSDSDDEGHKSIRKSQTVDDSNVMVDFESYFRYGPEVAKIGDTVVRDDIYECLCPDCTSNEALEKLFKPGYDKMVGESTENWEDLQYLLCPPRVLGYILKDKQWAQLAVNSLRIIEHEESSNVLKQLHLSGPGKDGGKRKKELLFGLVQNHGMDNDGLEDLVAEKGKGLIFLLYGAPGVGKTSTAQMIARAAGKPLFTIGVADVSTVAWEVESRLETIFDLATKWGAILLIDEADVFLQSRSQNTLGPSAEGSALVSVFLRVLEYYRGIMFLTTNQIAQFDVAVQSRVHIALKYDRLDEEQTYKIFMGFIDQYDEKNAVDRDDYEKIKIFGEEDLHSKEFDGRQIRNIVACARGYARAKKPSQKLKLEHIMHVIRFVEDFQKDLAGQMKRWRDQQKATRI